MIRKRLWNFLTKKIVSEKSILQSHYFPCDSDLTSAMPIENRYPGLKDCNLVVSKNTPLSEKMNATELKRLKLGFWLQKNIPLDKYQNPYTSDESSYPKDYEKMQPPPWKPEALDPNKTLSEIAIKGPFSHLTAKRDDGLWELDVSNLENYKTQNDYFDCGGKIILQEQSGSFNIDHIISFGEVIKPKDKSFPIAQKKFISALCSYSTLIDHLVNCHLATCGAYAISFTEILSAKHPLRIIMHPTIVETFTVNDYQIDGLILNEQSNVPIYTGYPLQTLNEMIKSYSKSFNLAMMDPIYLAKKNESYEHDSFKTVNSSIDIWSIMLKYYNSLCDLYFSEIDTEVKIWIETIDRYIPNGVKDYLEISNFNEVRSNHLAKLLTLQAYTSSVKHFIVGTMTRNYFMFPKIFPSVIQKDTLSAPDGVAMLRTNSATIAGISRYKLIDNSIPMPSKGGKKIQKKFFDELDSYSKSINHDQDKNYMIDPNELLSSIHA